MVLFRFAQFIKISVVMKISQQHTTNTHVYRLIYTFQHFARQVAKPIICQFRTLPFTAFQCHSQKRQWVISQVRTVSLLVQMLTLGMEAISLFHIIRSRSNRCRWKWYMDRIGYLFQNCVHNNNSGHKNRERKIITIYYNKHMSPSRI